MHVLVTCKYKKDRIKNQWDKVETSFFLIISQWVNFCCHGNQSFDPICPKTLCSLFPPPVMLHIKFDQGWPIGFRDIQVWKCGRQRQMDDEPLVYYKLTLWAFGSGELNIWARAWQKQENDMCKKQRLRSACASVSLKQLFVLSYP